MSLKEFFKDDKFAALAGCELLDIKPGYATARMKVEPQLHNATGVCQGGALFTLADFAFAAAVNSHGRVTVSVNSSIAIHKSVSEGWLYATATETLDHRKLPYCVVEIKDEAGNLSATFTGLAYRFPENDPRNQMLPPL